MDRKKIKMTHGMIENRAERGQKGHLVTVLPRQGDNWKLLNAVFLETPKATVSQSCRKLSASQHYRQNKWVQSAPASRRAEDSKEGVWGGKRDLLGRGCGISCDGEEPKTSRGCSRGTWGRSQRGTHRVEVPGWC